MLNNHSVISLFKDKRKFVNNFNLIEDNDGMMITKFYLQLDERQEYYLLIRICLDKNVKKRKFTNKDNGK